MSSLIQIIKSIVFTALVALFFCFKVMAAEQAVAVVNSVGVNSNDVVFFNIDTPLSIQDCTGKQIVIPPASVFKDRILAVVLAAQASKAKIVVKVSGCYNGTPAIEPGKAGWVYITN